VKGIPEDQRGIKTIARVGGLVGKTVSIDESTRYNPIFVRVKIACRDIMEVPDVAEGTLGMNIFDFQFEREDSDNTRRDRPRAGVRVEESGNQPSPKN
jgi:hypothetical protein